MNDNGDQMCDFSELNGLLVGGTLFQHKDVHKRIWTSPDGNTKAQLDHIIIANGKAPCKMSGSTQVEIVDQTTTW